MRLEEQEVTNHLQNIMNDLARFEKKSKYRILKHVNYSNLLKRIRSSNQSLQQDRAKSSCNANRLMKKSNHLVKKVIRWKQKRAQVKLKSARTSRSGCFKRTIQSFYRFNCEEHVSKKKMKHWNVKESLEKQLANLTADFTDHEMTEESLREKSASYQRNVKHYK